MTVLDFLENLVAMAGDRDDIREDVVEMVMNSANLTTTMEAEEMTGRLLNYSEIFLASMHHTLPADPREAP